MKIVFNGAIQNIQDTPCDLLGWLNGSGVFETLRTENAQVFAFGPHMQRAKISAQILGFNLPYNNEVQAGVDELLAQEAHEIGLLRISFDVSGDWAAVHLPYKPPSALAKIRTHPDLMVPSGRIIKSYPYSHRLAIVEEARLLGFDEAIVVNTEGNICEGAVSNIIVCLDGQWRTPPLSDGVLPGIMRELVIENSAVTESSIPAARIGEITSAILLSSLRIAQSVESIDGRELTPSPSFNAQIHAVARQLWVG